MASTNWELLKQVNVPARPDGLWTLVCEDLPDFKRLKIVATGQWEYTNKFPAVCTADGDLQSPLDAARCLFPQAPVGALIGKFGGSSVGTNDGTIFVVGAACVYERASDNKAAHPSLFLSINDERTGFGDNVGEVSVSIFKSR